MSNEKRNNTTTAKQIEEPKESFTKIPRVEDISLCPECKEGLSEIDRGESACGSGVWVTTFYYCSGCGYHNIGDAYRTSDY